MTLEAVYKMIQREDEFQFELIKTAINPCSSVQTRLPCSAIYPTN